MVSGGSDTTAAALAATLAAEECRIYTDVDGVYSADPRICADAKRLSSISYEDMYALAQAGAQVLHDKCVALAQKHGVVLEVRSSVTDQPGTYIGPERNASGITGVTWRSLEGNTAAVTLVGKELPSLKLEKQALQTLTAAGIEVSGIQESNRSLTLVVNATQASCAVCALHAAMLAG